MRDSTLVGFLVGASRELCRGSLSHVLLGCWLQQPRLTVTKSRHIYHIDHIDKYREEGLRRLWPSPEACSSGLLGRGSEEGEAVVGLRRIGNIDSTQRVGRLLGRSVKGALPRES